MDKVKQRVTSLALFGLLVILMGASTAWACVPQPLITLSPQASGPAGSRVTVDGLAIEGTVEIRWDAVDGPLLGKAMGPTFSAEVTIPEASEGLHAIIVAERRPDGGLGSTGRASYEVTAPARSSVGGEAMASGQGTTADGTTSTNTSSSTPPFASGGLLLAGGAGLLAVGAIGGAVFSRRHWR
jgi:hypothetical protein